MSFKNKTVVVTGSSSGIGATVAVMFAQQGADVVIVGRNENKLTNVKEEIIAIGKQPLVIKADVSKDNEARRIIEETVATYGKIDVFVNNAGFARQGGLTYGDIMKSFDDVIATNLRAAVNLTTLAIPYLKKTKGNVIIVSSVVSKKVFQLPDLLTYGVSKAGLNYFSKGAAKELAPYGIRVNIICPGPTRTDIMNNSGFDMKIEDLVENIPLKRVSETEEIGDMILFLASDKAKGITGSEFVIDNGALL